MKSGALRFALLSCALAGAASGAAQAQLTLVQDGARRSVIVLDTTPTASARMAAEELRRAIQRASGAVLPIVEARRPQDAPAGVKLVVSGGALAQALGVDVRKLEPEEYIVRSGKDFIVFAGRDMGDAGQAGARSSAATLWAARDFLDRELGARWLWPGATGFYAPPRKTIAPGPQDIQGRPALETRILRVSLHRPVAQGQALLTPGQRARLAEEANLWLAVHGMGSRSEFRFGHAFMNWWERFSKTRPEYFAKPPQGQSQPWPRAERVKLCVSEPAVAEQILADWRAAGSPVNWNVCPNDGAGFCSCARCRALDVPPGQSPEAAWRGTANLTGRYVHLWSRLAQAMRRENPKATVSSYAYSAYRNPIGDMTLPPGVVLGMVHTYTAREEWGKWSQAGARLLLRPNWWHMGGPAPHIPLRKAGGYFRFAMSHSMIGINFDSLVGFWGVQGAYYYLIARLSVRPDLSVEDVIEEYCSAFGGATPEVKKYLQYWEDFTERAAYTVPAGGAVSQNPNGLFEQVCRKQGFANHSIASGYRVLPHLYTNEVLAPAEGALERAAALAAKEPGDGLAPERVQFLRDGLAHLRLVRDIMALAEARPRPRSAEAKKVQAMMEQLAAMRREMTPRHVVWGELAAQDEARRGRFKPGPVRRQDVEGM